MLNQDAAQSNLASFTDDPVDHLEPGAEIEETAEQREKRVEREAYREAAIKGVAFLHSCFAFIKDSSNDREESIRFWAVLTSIDHPICEGRSDSDIARSLGTTRANLSKHKLAFQRQNSLPPTLSQKSVEARNTYSEVRTSQLAHESAA